MWEGVYLESICVFNQKTNDDIYQAILSNRCEKIARQFVSSNLIDTNSYTRLFIKVILARFLSTLSSYNVSNNAFDHLKCHNS